MPREFKEEKKETELVRIVPFEANLTNIASLCLEINQKLDALLAKK